MESELGPILAGAIMACHDEDMELCASMSKRYVQGLVSYLGPKLEGLKDIEDEERSRGRDVSFTGFSWTTYLLQEGIKLFPRPFDGKVFHAGMELDRYSALYLVFGGAFMEFGFGEEAVEAIEAAIAVEPRQAELYAIAGSWVECSGSNEGPFEDPSLNAMFGVGADVRRDKAMSMYAKALELDPNNGVAHFNLAGMLLGYDDVRAQEHYQKAHAINPTLFPIPPRVE